MPSSRSQYGSQINAGKIVKKVIGGTTTDIAPTYIGNSYKDYGRLKLAQDKAHWGDQLGAGAALFPILSAYSVHSAQSWSSGVTLQSGGSSQILLVGAGGGTGGGNRQGAGAGAVLRVTLPIGLYNLRGWAGKGGGDNSSAVNLDNSGYGANGGAGGSYSSGGGGQGGTPSIVEITNDGVSWSLFAMAGAGGGGGSHTNQASARGGGGGNWFAHTYNANQFRVAASNVYEGTLAGGWQSGSGNWPIGIAGANTANTYLSGTGVGGPGGDADTLNQYAGGNGGSSTSSNPGGGGGGGYGGGGGGGGGGAGGSPGAGGYFQDGATRFGGTGGGGWHPNNCGGGGGGGGSYYPLSGGYTVLEEVGTCMGYVNINTSFYGRAGYDWNASQYFVNTGASAYGLSTDTGRAGSGAASTASNGAVVFIP